MTQPQEVLRNYQQLLTNNNTVSQPSFSSMVLNGSTIQGGNNLVSKQTTITRRRKKVAQATNETFIIYLLTETDSKKLFVSDGFEVQEANDFPDAVPNTFSASISKIGTNFDDWLIVGSYEKESDSRYRVQFYLTVDELIEDDVKAMYSSRPIVLSTYFRVGDTVYTAPFETPITVGESNTASGYITTRYAPVSRHFGHGWCYSANTFTEEPLSPTINLFTLGETPLNEQLADQFYSRGGTNREKNEVYYLGTFEGQPAILLEDVGAGGFGASISGRFFEKALITIDPDTGAEIYPDLRGRILQNTIYALEYLGFTEETVPVVGGEPGDTTFVRIFAYRMPIPLPIDPSETIAVFIGSLNNRVLRSKIVETYFDQKQGVVKRRLYDSNPLFSDKEFDLWLDKDNKIIDTARLLLAPATDTEEPSNDQLDNLYITREIGIGWTQGFEQSTQLYTRSTTLLGDAGSGLLEYESIFVDEQSESLIVDSRDYYEDPEDYTPFGLPSLLAGSSNLIGNVITTNTDITLTAPPTSEEIELPETPEFEDIYTSISESRYPNSL